MCVCVCVCVYYVHNVSSSNSSYDVESTHYYFRVSDSDKASWLFEELPFFQPKRSLFLKEPSQQRGIHCRFGMRCVCVCVRVSE